MLANTPGPRTLDDSRCDETKWKDKVKHGGCRTHLASALLMSRGLTKQNGNIRLRITGLANTPDLRTFDDSRFNQTKWKDKVKLGGLANTPDPRTFDDCRFGETK